MYHTYRRDRRTAIIMVVIISLIISVILLIISTIIYAALRGTLAAHVIIDSLAILYMATGLVIFGRILEEAGYDRATALRRTFILLIVQILIILGALYL